MKKAGKNAPPQAQTEESFLETGLLSRQLAEESPLGILYLDLQGRITFENRAMRRMMGVPEGSPSPVLGVDFFALTSIRAALEPAILQRFASGTAFSGEVFHYRSLLGPEVDLEVYSAPLKDARGSLAGTILMALDVTQRKQAEAQLTRRAEQFELLYDIGLTLNSVLEPEKQLDTILDLIQKALNSMRADFFYYDPAQDSLLLALTRHYPDRKIIDELKKLRFPVGQERGLLGLVARDRQLLYLPDVSADPRWIPIDVAIGSAMWMPVVREDRLFGVVCVSSAEKNAFSPTDQRLFQLFASQVAVAMENTRLFEETLQRLAELESINQVSRAMRVAHDLDEMLPILLEDTLEVLHAASGSIWLYDSAHNQLRLAAVRGWGDPGELPPPHRPLAPGEGIAGLVFSTGQVFISPDLRQEPRLSEMERKWFQTAIGGATVPIRAGISVIGTISVHVSLPRQLTAGEIHLLTTLSEIAGSAILRTTLHEQTERRLRHLQALSDIDRAITSSFDLRVSLPTLLGQVTSQLGVDAASVLLFNPATRAFEFVAGHGFRRRVPERDSVSLSESYAGQAALEHRIIHIPNLATGPDNPLFRRDMSEDAFICYYGVPLIAKGQVNGVLEIFNRTPLDPDEEWLDFLKVLAEEAAIAIDNTTLFESLQGSNADLVRAYDATIEGWSRALDLRDRETEGHTRRVTEMALRLGRAFALSDDELVQMRWGALLHDIGKMGIPDDILFKPSALTDEEWLIMKKHPVFAYEMLSPIRYLRAALDIPYGHHEKWDGTGYPRGLRGDQIPLTARIFAVVDVWDALNSDRPYRPAWPAEKARLYIQSLSGTHFDPQVVQLFLASGLAEG